MSATFNVDRDKAQLPADKVKENTKFVGLSQAQAARPGRRSGRPVAAAARRRRHGEHQEDCGTASEGLGGNEEGRRVVVGPADPRRALARRQGALSTCSRPSSCTKLKFSRAAAEVAGEAAAVRSRRPNWPTCFNCSWIARRISMKRSSARPTRARRSRSTISPTSCATSRVVSSSRRNSSRRAAPSRANGRWRRRIESTCARRRSGTGGAPARAVAA